MFCMPFDVDDVIDLFDDDDNHYASGSITEVAQGFAATFKIWGTLLASVVAGIGVSFFFGGKWVLELTCGFTLVGLVVGLVWYFKGKRKKAG